MGATLGIDIGGSKLLATILDSAGTPQAWTRLATGSDFGPGVAVPAIAALASELSTRGEPLEALGVGFPGLVDADRGLVISSVMIPGWDGFPFAESLANATGVRCRIDNDANNAARAELHVRGAAAMDMLFITVGTGIGGAVVLDGRLWRGVRGLAGEIGHVRAGGTVRRCSCGRRGCVSVLASGPAMERRLGVPNGSLSGSASMRNGRTASAVKSGSAALGVAVAGVLNVLDLQLVVLAGGVAQLGERYRAAVERVVKREALPEIAADCHVELSRAGYGAGALGAALLAGGRFDASSTLTPAVAAAS